MTILLLAALGCSGDDKPPRDTGDKGDPLAPACSLEPCVTDVAAASWQGDFDGSAFGGYALAATESAVVVGVPSYNGQLREDTRAVVLALPDLIPLGSWLGGSSSDYTGLALASGDIDGDGRAEVAVGAPTDPGVEGERTTGAVHLLAGSVTGDVRTLDAAMLSIMGTNEASFGGSLFFSDDGQALVVYAKDRDGSNYRILTFPTTARGRIPESEAATSVTSDTPLGVIVPWDGDQDGLADLVVQELEGPAWFPAPWTTSTIADKTGWWTDPCATDCGIAQTMSRLGDISGDGGDDLAVAAPLYEEPAERAGRMFVLSEGTPGEHAIDTSAIQVHGTDAYDGMGFAAAGADVDGDGQQDLVVSASGVSPGTAPGKLMVFRGPVAAGIYTAADADALVYGASGYDLFVRSIAVVDADGDARDDLVVGAPGAAAGAGDGAVYLLNGADLL